jgi:hypothetical protein
MNLYLVSQTENCNYDTYDSMVVAAETEEEARNTMPDSFTRWGQSYSEWASSPDKVTVLLIGTAVEGTTAGVICSSYNAG